jgi:hypothetical protein
MATDPTGEDPQQIAERMKEILLKNTRLRNLICSVLMEIAADQILSDAIEENPDSV